MKNEDIKNEIKETKDKETEQNYIPTLTPNLEIPTIAKDINIPATTEHRRSSALSLFTATKKNKEKNNHEPSLEVDLPKNSFSDADFIVFWKKYIEILEKQGQKMLSSILSSTQPTLENTTIKITYPNAMMMEEVKKNQILILSYLREKLQNFEVSFELNFNDDIEKNYAYTAQEKFEKMMEINPLIGEFRIRFELDI